MEVWTTLKNLFSAQSKARSMQVHFQLNTLKKGNSSIADYYHKFQALTDMLSSISQPLTDVQMQSFLLGVLNPDKRNRGQSSGLFISAFVVPIIEDDAPIIIIRNGSIFPLASNTRIDP